MNRLPAEGRVVSPLMTDPALCADGVRNGAPGGVEAGTKLGHGEEDDRRIPRPPGQSSTGLTIPSAGVVA